MPDRNTEEGAARVLELVIGISPDIPATPPTS